LKILETICLPTAPFPSSSAAAEEGEKIQPQSLPHQHASTAEEEFKKKNNNHHRKTIDDD
jgi:hypothetical protein